MLTLATLQKLTEEEQKLFRLYGKLPTHKNVLTKMQKVRLRRPRSVSSRVSNQAFARTQDRKYFDSGDYALSKAGKAPQNTVGTAIPSPEKCVPATVVMRIPILISSRRALQHPPRHLSPGAPGSLCVADELEHDPEPRQGEFARGIRARRGRYGRAT